jgi:ABC-type uncharacterized transport system auxiliary subunit
VSRLSLAALAALLLCGCLFRDTAEPRFFRPGSAAIDAQVPDPPPRDAVPVRLRPVGGTPFLRERIAWRSSSVEYGLYEQWRWSDLPVSYAQRALETSLRKTPGIRLTDDYRAPTLRVELVAFEEILAPAHAASVALAASLDDRKQEELFDRTFSAEIPIEKQDPAALAVAMGKALDQVVGELAAAVGKAVHARPAR